MSKWRDTATGRELETTRGAIHYVLVSDHETDIKPVYGGSQ